jgi:DNA-binding CsgD family transcriptional regulator
VDEDQLGALIETIYTSAFEEVGWDRLMETLRTEFHASQVGLATAKMPENLLIWGGITAGSSCRENYVDRYHALDPTLPAFLHNESSLRLLRVFLLTAFVDRSAYLKSEFLWDYLKPHDMGQPIVSLLEHSGPLFTPMWIHRPVTGSDFAHEEQNLLVALTPHLARSLHIYRELGKLCARADLFETTFDTLDATFLLDASGRVLRLNRAAGQHLEGGGLLTLVGGRLGTRHPADDAVLAAAFVPGPIAAPAEIVLRGPAYAIGLRLSVTPVNGRNIPLFGKMAQSEQLAFMVTATTLGPSLQNLMALYGLTRAEAEVTLLLTQGLPAAQIAAHRETSVGTVNTQLKQIYAKTGADGQVALLLKLLGR